MCVCTHPSPALSTGLGHFSAASFTLPFTGCRTTVGVDCGMYVSSCYIPKYYLTEITRPPQPNPTTQTRPSIGADAPTDGVAVAAHGADRVPQRLALLRRGGGLVHVDAGAPEALHHDDADE